MQQILSLSHSLSFSHPESALGPTSEALVPWNPYCCFLLLKCSTVIILLLKKQEHFLKTPVVNNDHTSIRPSLRFKED